MDALLIIFASIFCLLVGSFLNVVIIRLPVIMHRNWRDQCNDLIKIQKESPLPDLNYIGTYNLATPPSHCLDCQHAISIFENIPILSYFLLKGRCKQCHKPISIRYPLIEALTTILATIVILHFGFQWQTVFAVLLTFSLIVLAIIDIDHQLLPDDITLPMLWLGLILSLYTVFQNPQDAILGACLGYLSLWSVYWIFKLMTQKEGMGQGDFKLLAMLGAWLGWQSLPIIILLSAFSGAFVGIFLIFFKKHPRYKPIPFGPFLALAGWITLLWGDKLNNSYFQIVGL